MLCRTSCWRSGTRAVQCNPHPADAAGWIYGIAANQCIDLARLDPDAAQILGLYQELGYLNNALRRLAPEQAEMLRSACVAGLRPSRISDDRLPAAYTVKSRIHLSLNRLRHVTSIDYKSTVTSSTTC